MCPLELPLPFNIHRLEGNRLLLYIDWASYNFDDRLVKNTSVERASQLVTVVGIFPASLSSRSQFPAFSFGCLPTSGNQKILSLEWGTCFLT